MVMGGVLAGGNDVAVAVAVAVAVFAAVAVTVGGLEMVLTVNRLFPFLVALMLVSCPVFEVAVALVLVLVLFEAVLAVLAELLSLLLLLLLTGSPSVSGPAVLAADVAAEVETAAAVVVVAVVVAEDASLTVKRVDFFGEEETVGV